VHFISIENTGLQAQRLPEDLIEFADWVDGQLRTDQAFKGMPGAKPGAARCILTTNASFCV
jgi:hypothetical protein